MKQSAVTDLDHHTADLAICAFFFACRSCEHLKVQGPRRTKTLRKGDIQFCRGRSVLPHNSPDLHLADTVATLFRNQKNRVKGVWRTAWATSDPDASPVIFFSNVIRRIDSLPGSNDDTLLCTYAASSNRSLLAVADANMTSTLRAALTAIGKDELGCTAADVGTHSIRSGAAMAMVLSGHTAWRIMLAGRWQSQAFLAHIQEQIQQFSKGVSERMTANPDFYHVPDIDAAETVEDEPTQVGEGIFGGNSNMPRLSFTT
jgi:hypothetical protein